MRLVNYSILICQLAALWGGLTPQMVRAGERDDAALLDNYLHGKVPFKSIESRVRACKRNSRGLFCPAWKRAKKFSRQMKSFRPIAKPFSAPEIADVFAIEKSGNLQNLKSLRKAEVKALLKWVEGLSQSEIKKYVQISLKEKRCPNRLSLALGVALENYFPSTSAVQIAKLYEHGGRCFRSTDRDRANFLTRAGIFFYYENQFKDAVRVLSKVPSIDAYDGRHLYWLAKAYRKLDNGKSAQKVSDRLIRQHPLSFHALLSSLESGKDLWGNLPEKTIKPMSRSRKSSNANRWAALIEVLDRFGHSESASFLVNDTLKNYRRTEPEFKLYLLKLGDARLQIEAAPNLFLNYKSLRSKTLLQFAYPERYWELISANSSSTDPYLLLAFANKESRFDAKAVSIADARGLLQLIPKTASQFGGNDSSNLFDPATNIDIASRYLKHLMKLYNDRIPLVMAAYNAGEDAVTSWQKRYFHADPIIFLDLIPFRETRNYVGFVLMNYYWYKRLHNDHHVALSELIPQELARK